MCHFHNLASIDRGFLSYLALSPHVSQLFIFTSPFIMNYSTIPVGDKKNPIRKYVWNVMDAHDVARFPGPVHGIIHHFERADRAAERLNEETYCPLTCLAEPYIFNE